MFRGASIAWFAAPLVVLCAVAVPSSARPMLAADRSEDAGEPSEPFGLDPWTETAASPQPAPIGEDLLGKEPLDRSDPWVGNSADELDRTDPWPPADEEASSLAFDTSSPWALDAVELDPSDPWRQDSE